MLAREKSNTIAKIILKYVLNVPEKRSYLTNKLQYGHDTNIFELLM